MTIDGIRAFCLSLPHATEDVQWGSLLFRIAGKIFATTALEAGDSTKLCFKCTPEEFAELIEREGIVPAPYMARNHWVALTETDALRTAELRERIERSYRLIFSKLPKKTQRELGG